MWCTLEKVTFHPLENGDVTFEVPFFKSYKFELASTLKDGTLAFNYCFDGTDTYTVNFNTIRTVSLLLKSSGFEVDSSELLAKYGKPLFMDLGQLFLRDEQYEYMKKVMNYFSGLLTLPTGFGKNTMIVYLIQASLHRRGNILIMAPTYSIVEEIISRCEQYNVQVSKDYNVTSKVWAVNPVGLVNSKRLENPEIVQWLQDCTMLIMDECQEVNNSQETLITEYLPKCIYKYGTSASSDKFTGLNLTSFTNLSKINPETFRILKYFGPAIVYKAPQRKIRVVDTIVPFGNYRNVWSYDKCINHLCHHRLMPRYIEKCIEDNNKDEKSAIIFPFTNRAHVSHLLEDRSLYKYHLIMWTATGIKHNRDLPEEKGAGLERVKELINSHEVDLMFCTSVGFKGVDVSGFRSVIFMTSSSYGMVTQILGRAFRYKGKGLVNVYIARCEGDNPLYNASYWKRRKMLLDNNEHILEIHKWGELQVKEDELFGS